jgi:hypothetical protein
MTVQPGRSGALALLGGAAALVCGAAPARADFLGLAQEPALALEAADVVAALPSGSGGGGVVTLSVDEGRCRLDWWDTQQTAFWTALDEDSMPVDAECAGIAPTDAERVALLARPAGGEWVLVDILRDGQAAAPVALDAALIDQAGARIFGRGGAALVVGEHGAGAGASRYAGAPLASAWGRDLSMAPCLEGVVDGASLMGQDVLLARACGEEGLRVWSLDEAGAPTGLMLAEAGTMRPEALVPAAGGFYVLGAALMDGEATGLRWLYYDAAMEMVTREATVMGTAVFAGDQKWGAAGQDGLYLLTASEAGITGLHLFSPGGALVGSTPAGALPMGAPLALVAFSDGGARLLTAGAEGVSVYAPGLVVDGDGDGVGDDADNCPEVANADQADADMDDLGDACDEVMDLDGDGDGVADGADNCPEDANADQADLDEDAQGDACDDDQDGDGVANGEDNCPRAENANQADADNNGVGDACQRANDRDGDGIDNGADNCPEVANADQADLDRDDLGDACDPDIEGDGVINSIDNCDRVANFNQRDVDQDGLGDACDPDRDGDGQDNDEDSCPSVVNAGRDNDRDGVDNACDPDIDGDNIPNGSDNCPTVSNRLQEDGDVDGVGDACDETLDARDGDRDGISDARDNCPEVANPDQRDINADGEGDACDADQDGDGVPNGGDNCPAANNPFQGDDDGDGVGDACDDQLPEPNPNLPPQGEETDTPRRTPGSPVPPIDNGCAVAAPAAPSPLRGASGVALLIGLALLARRRQG